MVPSQTMLSEKATLSGTISDSLDSAPRRRITLTEQFWVDSYQFLLSRGYRLRPRYHTSWVPSWGNGSPIRQRSEDFFASYAPHALDGRCLKDNRKVVLKRVKGKELEILRHLDALRSDARNRTIPILDYIPFPGTEWTFVVMPYGRPFNSPPFHCRDEFVDAMRQYIEGLQFIHEHNIVHFDVAPQNMLTEECRLIPRGSHWSHPDSHSGHRGDFFSWKNRCSLRPALQYYYIDFGLSMHFPHRDSARMTGTLRTFPMIPELSLTVPYNPFYVDVFQLGLVMSRIIDVYPALEEFRPVAASLTRDDPHTRATLEGALQQLNSVHDGMLPLRRRRIWDKGTTRWKKVTRIVFGGQWGLPDH
ncbi:kinase-like domain-containing protein [Mycena alexandri]|uniref:Kinase-like domain-containing protein n=1 Tax=Mycena alexandri TaxID=1745969 RepID=A0AAD6S2Z1_9AGAR|nr:kinase-like domain-containing protein [Mycena alexandri]